MAVVKKAQSSSRVAAKKATRTVSVTSARQPSQLEEMGDTAFGTLDASKDGLVVSYDGTTDKFILVTPDSILNTSAEDGDVSDEFVTQLESELNLGDIQVESLDGGGF